MSKPSEVSEKVVWLENNMPLWFVYSTSDEGISDVEDVVNTVLAHLSPRGVNELYSLMVELVEADELFKKIPMKGWTPKDLKELKEATISDPPWNPDRGNMMEGTNGEK